MSSGFTHLTTFLAIGGGILLGSWVANRFRNRYIFLFAVSVLIGWLIHMGYDLWG